jgi:uncharacterized protein involved in outer membrane biogenesis
MKMRRKALSWFGGAILLVALAAALALHALVDPERLGEIAREKAESAWGRELTVGDVSLDLWPVPMLRAENVALSNPEWAAEPHFLHAERASARLKLLPLLTGKVLLHRLELQGVTAELETSADGTSNVPSSSRPRVPGKSPTAALLDLTGVRIENADIHERTKDAPPTLWHVDEATFEAEPALRDVHVKASLARNQLPLAVSARFEDLSRFGDEGATTAGKVELDWGKTQLAISGQLPIGAGLRGYAVTADLKSASLADMSGFLELAQRPPAAAEAHLEMRDDRGTIDVTRLDVTLGKLKVGGAAKVSLRGARNTFDARLEADRMDWAQAMLDAGGRPVPPLKPDEIFHDTPLEWGFLVALQATQGTADVLVRSLRLRNGVELRNFKSRIAFDGDRMSLNPFAAELLGGSASGSIVLEGRTKSAKVDFSGARLLLERWFHECGSRIPLTGGPMTIDARFSAAGESMKALAATLTGPVTIRMGPAVWASKKASDAEATMTNAFAAKDASQIDFECVAAALPFRSGVASAKPLVGFRTTASALVTSGKVDLGEASLELSGRVKPRSGVTLGLATIAGNVKIAGPLRHPKMTLDPASMPSLIARAGAAIATFGISALGTAVVDAADAKKNDPCGIALGAR